MKTVILVRRCLFWWSAVCPGELVSNYASPTTLRALTRRGVIEKWRRRLEVGKYRPDTKWEEVEL